MIKAFNSQLFFSNESFNISNTCPYCAFHWTFQYVFWSSPSFSLFDQLPRTSPPLGRFKSMRIRTTPSSRHSRQPTKIQATHIPTHWSKTRATNSECSAPVSWQPPRQIWTTNNSRLIASLCEQPTVDRLRSHSIRDSPLKCWTWMKCPLQFP